MVNPNKQAQTIQELLLELDIEDKVMAAAVNMDVVKKMYGVVFN